MELIQRSQARQNELRTKLNPHAVRAQTLSEKLDNKSDDVVELEAQVRALVASHAACINAVMVSGGMAALQRFWKQYREVVEKLRTVSAYPDAAEVVKLGPQKR
jgi:predicted  nucleic acid-binding Zn-ribbon protein